MARDPGGRRNAHALDAQACYLVELPCRGVQRSPLCAVPVFVLSVPLQTVQRYRRRRPDFVANQPWPTMLRPGFPKLSHPGLQHAIPSIAFIAQVYRGGETRRFLHDLGG